MKKIGVVLGLYIFFGFMVFSLSVFAENDRDLAQDVIDSVCDNYVVRYVGDSLDVPINHTASDLVRNLQGNLIDGSKTPYYYILDGAQILNYEIGEKKYQYLIQGKLYYTSDGGMYTIQAPDGSNLSTNVLYIDINFSDGAIYHYRLYARNYLSVSKNTTYTRIYLSGVEVIDPLTGSSLGTGYTCSWDFYFDNNAKLYKTLPDFDSRYGTGSYTYLDGFLPSANSSASTKQVYPYTLNLALGSIYTLTHSDSVTNVTKALSVSRLYAKYIESNDSALNTYITNQPYSPTYHYYNNYFQGNTTYNSSTTNIENIIENSDKDRTLNLPSLPDLSLPDVNLPDFDLPDLPDMPDINLPDVPGGSVWIPPKYDKLNTSPIITTRSSVELIEVTFPTSVLSNGGTILESGLDGLTDCMPELVSVALVCMVFGFLWKFTGG